MKRVSIPAIISLSHRCPKILKPKARSTFSSKFRSKNQMIRMRCIKRSELSLRPVASLNVIYQAQCQMRRKKEISQLISSTTRLRGLRSQYQSNPARRTLDYHSGARHKKACSSRSDYPSMPSPFPRGLISNHSHPRVARMWLQVNCRILRRW